MERHFLLLSFKELDHYTTDWLSHFRQLLDSESLL